MEVIMLGSLIAIAVGKVATAAITIGTKSAVDMTVLKQAKKRETAAEPSLSAVREVFVGTAAELDELKKSLLYQRLVNRGKALCDTGQFGKCTTCGVTHV